MPSRPVRLLRHTAARVEPRVQQQLVLDIWRLRNLLGATTPHSRTYGVSDAERHAGAHPSPDGGPDSTSDLTSLPTAPSSAHFGTHSDAYVTTYAIANCEPESYLLVRPGLLL